MLKNINLPIFIGLITSISAISIQPAAYASTTFCNQTAFPVEVAYARGTFDPRPSIEVTNYQIKGWLTIDPGACMTASTEPADKVVRPDGYYLVRHYYYAKSTNKNITLTGETSQRTEKFCIKDTNFKYARAIGYTSTRLKCDSPKARLRQRGYKQVDFSTFDSNKPNYTVSLTSSQSSPVKTGK